ncbi:hypothetical protein TSUD_256540 [Trifolium subterraneum]|uniref:DUF4408 domain-containing protein n=1 Tax=Trifolium subterraneum TaxID=3900 RepID=A0A2Z6M7S0_TRISU|nr:hypothetical protein TSUD_256540 [Trifolium subterraneum]
MFLLCNGLLVFVGLTKSFSASSSDDEKSSDNSDDLSSSKYIEEEDHGLQSHILDVEANEPMLETEDDKITSEPDEQNAAAEEEAEEEVEENIENIIFIDEEQGEEMNEEEQEVELFDANDEVGDKGSKHDYILIEENNIEEEEEEESCISTEELNKKFEDFIRKMKEDLRIDARRHLIMV